MQLLLTPDWQAGITALSMRLINDLEAGRKVLWLVPGGSNIKAACTVMSLIPDGLSANLTVTLSDERYGEYGHADSNWRQLSEAGFDLKQARGLPVLKKGLKDLESTVESFDMTLAAALSTTDVAIAHLGMGPDGHIAGILPSTPAVSTSGLATGYETETYTRITMTFEAFKQLDAAYVLAFGDEKRPALERLMEEVSLDEQPAQILKKVPESFVFNDQIGDPA